MRISRSSLAVLLALVLGASACASGNVTDLSVGDCFNDPDDLTEVTDVEMVECTEPHDNEVFYIYEIDAIATDLEYAEGCLPEFESYVGAAYETSEIFIGTLAPLPEGFANGDNEVICLGYLDGGEQLTESIQGSGR
ncbi:MAG: hypothetical protein AAGC53_19420 [Actinomycetota bacterium]